MKNVIRLIVVSAGFILLCNPVFAQSSAKGDWEGLLNIGSKKIKIILHVKEENSILKSTMDSPDQGVVNIPISETSQKEDSIFFADTKMRINISGQYRDDVDSIFAGFHQRGARIGINFGRSSITEIKLNRPQTPKPPFPYTIEDLFFVNKKANGIKLAGTLTIPKDKANPPVVVFISGSGPQNRNEKAFDHEPFLILSDYLSRNGIAVLRFDDRGVAQSEGDFSKATSYDFSTDAEAALEYLKTRKDVDTKKIGLLGHSEGGMIAPMVAARNKDVAFIVLLAGPAVGLDKLMLKQTEDLLKSENQDESKIKITLGMNGKVFELIKKYDVQDSLENKIRSVLDEYKFANGDQGSYKAFLKQTLSPWFKYFIRFNPSEYLEKVKCPVLAINGTLDKQVDADMNLGAMKTAFEKGKNGDFILNYLPGLNHAFQEAKTGNVSEYTMIEHTMSLKALETISKWINERF